MTRGLRAHLSKADLCRKRVSTPLSLENIALESTNIDKVLQITMTTIIRASLFLQRA